jgi:probable phosphoglycerate mutase
MKTRQTSISSQSCRICLVRHGETAWNTERRLQGHIDIPLNETGLSQAEATARSLARAGLNFSALYSSDLARARQTAAAIARTHALAPTHDPRLRERHYGHFQGLTFDEAEHRHPDHFRRFKARDPHFALPDNGESLNALAARVHAALEDIARQHAGETVAVVTHGGVLDIAHRLATGQALESAREFAIPNAALNWIEHTAGSWKLIAWADESHLQGALDELPDT